MASKPGGEHDDVEVVVALRGPDARGSDLLDPAAMQVDQVHVVEVEGLVVVGVQDRPLAPDRQVPRREAVGRLGIVDTRRIISR